MILEVVVVALLLAVASSSIFMFVVGTITGQSALGYLGVICVISLGQILGA